MLSIFNNNSAESKLANSSFFPLSTSGISFLSSLSNFFEQLDIWQKKKKIPYDGLKTSRRFFLFFFFFWPHHAAYGILVPPPEIKPSPHAVKVQSLNQWTAREDSLEVSLPLIYLTHYYHHHSYCYWKVRMGDLDARPSKVKKQAGLVERKVCFISDAGNWGSGVGGGHLSKGLFPPLTSRG